MRRLGIPWHPSTGRPILSILTLFLVALACGRAAPAAAQVVNGDLTVSSQGGPTKTGTFTSPEGSSGVQDSPGSCSEAIGYSGLSASYGALGMTVHAAGSASPGVCVAQSDAHGNVSFSDTFRVTSTTLPNGTPVTLVFCVRGRGLPTIAFSCASSVFDVVTVGATARLVVRGPGTASQVAEGAYGARRNCYDADTNTSTGLLDSAPANNSQILTLTNVPVGGLVDVSATISATASLFSLGSGTDGAYRMAMVFGYSSPEGARLLSVATNQECSPSGNCSDANLVRWTPQDPYGGSAGVGEAAPPARLLPATPTPAIDAVQLPFTLQSAGTVQVEIFAVTGALVARLDGGRRPAGPGAITWDGRTARGFRAPVGMYQARLVSPDARSSWRIVLAR